MLPLGIARIIKRALLLKTGQLTQYGGYPDDGSTRFGISKSYTVLTTGLYSGSTNITLNGKTDAHSNNCVIDTNTGRMWSRTISGSVGASSNGTLPFTTNGSGEGLFAFVATANSSGLAGYSDWRAPNIAELFSLMDFEAPNGLPDSTAFPVWNTLVISSTSTPSAAASNCAGADYNNGLLTSISKTAITYKVALVRG
jgi:hypothetical protein